MTEAHFRKNGTSLELDGSAKRFSNAPMRTIAINCTEPAI